MFKEKTEYPLWFIKKVEIRETEFGLGCFATEEIEVNEMFESAPVLVFKREMFREYEKETGVSHAIQDRVFAWPDDSYGLGLGFCSIYNHSNDANARHKRVTGEHPRIQFFANRRILKGEEICHHYAPKAGDLAFSNGGSMIPDVPITHEEVRTANRIDTQEHTDMRTPWRNR